MRRPWIVALLLGVGCVHAREHAAFHEQLEARTGHGVDADRGPEDPPRLPDGVSLADGLDRDEAVAIALDNNPNLRAAMARLDLADAELAAARRPQNPSLRLLFPLGPTSFTALIAWPIESLATMPGRVARARLGQDASVAAALTTSLDLVRDVRLAHADAVLASELLELRIALVDERRGLVEIVEVRARLGDISDAEVESTRAEFGLALDEQARAEAALDVAISRLRTALGWGLEPIELRPIAEPVVELPAGALAEAEARALEQRPELDGATLELQRARTQLRLERGSWLRLSAVAQTQPGGVQLGPLLDVPIFDQGQAGRARARAELAAASWRQRALREQIAGEVREAQLRFEQALRSHERYRDEIVASRARALEAVARAHELGDVDFGVVLLAQRDLDTARVRLAELGAEARRAHTELERALGHRLTGLDGQAEVQR